MDTKRFMWGDEDGLIVTSTIEKGGEGSGNFGHEGRPGEVGGSAPSNDYGISASTKWVNEDRPETNVDASIKWAKDIESRGWNVTEASEHLWDMGVYPQYHKLDYDPEWGLKPGTYTAYRVGETENDPTGIYFGPDPSELDAYAYDKADKTIHQYEVTIHNPLIVEDKNEIVRRFFKNRKDRDYEFEKARYLLRLGQKPRPYSYWIRSLVDGNKFGHDATAANRWLDSQLAQAIRDHGYDSLVLTSPELPATREIMVLDNDNNIVFLKELKVFKGGAGSGNFDHAGRPGKIGGSAPSWGVMTPGDIKVAGETLRDQKLSKAFDASAEEVNTDIFHYGWVGASMRTRSAVKKRLVEDISARSGVGKATVNKIVGQWASSSNDSDIRSLSLQEAASEEFGVFLSTWQKQRMDEKLKIMQDQIERRTFVLIDIQHGGRASYHGFTDEFAERVRNMDLKQIAAEAKKMIIRENDDNRPITSRKNERKVLRAIYEATQEWFAKHGYGPDDAVSIYRGAGSHAQFFKKLDILGDSVTRYIGCTIESWSLDGGVAEYFSKYIVHAKVPVRNIFSTALTGIGCLTEGELVVFGTVPDSIVRLYHL